LSQPECVGGEGWGLREKKLALENISIRTILAILLPPPFAPSSVGVWRLGQLGEIKVIPFCQIV